MTPLSVFCVSKFTHGLSRLEAGLAQVKWILIRLMLYPRKYDPYSDHSIDFTHLGNPAGVWQSSWMRLAEAATGPRPRIHVLRSLKTSFVLSLTLTSTSADLLHNLLVTAPLNAYLLQI